MPTLEQKPDATAAPETSKKNRHVVVALAHMNKRRDALLAQRRKIDSEIEELDQAILALE